jgi:ribosomal protein S18 acetylase RimI-like enzyme
MDVRAIKISDLDGFYSLFCDVSAEAQFSARSTPPPIEAVARALALVEKNSWPVYVIELAGQIVGSAEAYPESFCQAEGKTDVGILGMQVKREFRGCGYGAALLSAVARHCREIGFSSIELSVLKSNTAAKSLYVKAGFTWVEDLPMCVLPSGAADQPMKMRLLL